MKERSEMNGSDVFQSPIVKRKRGSIGSLIPPRPSPRPSPSASPRTPRTPNSEHKRISPEDESVHIQQHLMEKAQHDSDTFYLQEKLLSMELSAEFHAILESNPNDGFTEEVQAKALVRMVEAYYISQGTDSSKISQLPREFRPAFAPFWTADEEGNPTKLPGKTVEEMIKNIQVLYEQNFSGVLFCRAFAYALQRLESPLRNPMNVDGLLDAYALTLYSIKLLQGKVDEFLNMQFGDVIEEELDHYRSSEVDMTADDLLWCLGILLLRLGREIRKSTNVRDLNARLKPNFASMMNEELLVAQLVIQIRSESPVSYLTSYRSVMDVKKQVPPPLRQDWMRTAFDFVLQGLEASDNWGDPFYQYTFRTILAYFMPTRSYAPTPYTLKEIQEKLEEANEYKRQCRDEVHKTEFMIGEKHEASVEDLLERLPHESSTKLTQPLVDIFYYPKVSPRGRNPSPSRALERSCAHCHQPLQRTLKCHQCGQVLYCSEPCQAAHWKATHSFECTPQLKDMDCGNCGKEVYKKFSCAKCGRINYCNRKCQLAHWKNGHKQECKKL